MTIRTAGAASASSTSLTVAFPAKRPRMALVISEIGFTSTKALSQPGMVSGSTMMLEAKTSGKMKVKPAVITVLDEDPAHAETNSDEQRETGDDPDDTRFRTIAQDETD